MYLSIPNPKPQVPHPDSESDASLFPSGRRLPRPRPTRVPNAGALIVRVEFAAPLKYTYNKEH